MNQKISRSTGKAFLADWDFIQSLSGEDCCYCLTEQQAGWLLVQCIYASWLTRWYAVDEQQISLDWIEAFQADMEYRLMNPCCDDQPLTRFTATGLMEVSFDNGLTWSPATANDDPRLAVSLAPQLPGADGDTKRCNAAAAGRAYYESLADQLIADSAAWGSIFAMTAALVALIFVIIFTAPTGSFVVLIPLLIGLISALVTGGSAAFDAAMTDAVWDTFECILYCRMRDDASFSNGEWQTVKSDVANQLTGIAVNFLVGVIDAQGAHALTNAVRSDPAAVGDCDECACAEGCDWVVGIGTIISEDDAQITIASAPHAGDGNKPYVALAAPGAAGTRCCTLVDVEALITPGSHVFIVAATCGSETLVFEPPVYEGQDWAFINFHTEVVGDNFTYRFTK